MKFTKGSLDDITQYLFNTRRNQHYFCPKCGSGLLERGVNSGLYGVNLRRVGCIDWKTVECGDVDGKNNW